MADAKTEKQKIKEITDKLEEGLKALFESEKYKSYLSTMSKFHNYSFNNTLLIAMQKPEATLVAGYQAWQKNFNRLVNKGEKGIRIERFLAELERQDGVATEFDENLWYSLIDFATVFNKEDIRFTFKNGTEIKV